jgi:hypothetical protein
MTNTSFVLIRMYLKKIFGEIYIQYQQGKDRKFDNYALPKGHFLTYKYNNTTKRVNRYIRFIDFGNSKLYVNTSKFIKQHCSYREKQIRRVIIQCQSHFSRVLGSNLKKLYLFLSKSKELCANRVLLTFY